MRTTILIALAAFTASALFYTISMNNNTKISTIPPHVIEAFNTWKLTYGNLYQSPSENNYRLQIFYKNYREVEEINSQNLSWKAGINEFTGMSDEEFATKYLGVPEELVEQSQNYPKAPLDHLGAPPASFSWIGKNILVEEVQNQKSCGSCWAFATTAVAEAAYNIKQKPATPRKFSEQQITDCVTGNWGCRGGWPKTAFQYLINQSGMVDLKDYPYEATDTSGCRTAGKATTDRYKEWYLVGSNNNSLMTALTQQPISIILAVSLTFNKFKSGTYTDTTCYDQKLGLHAVTLVEYKSGAGGYWRLKNEWGPAWGDNGFINVQMVDGSSGICNMHMSSTYVVY